LGDIVVGDIVTLPNHWPTTMSQMSFFFLFHNIFLFLCTRVTLWLVNVTNVTDQNVTQVLSEKYRRPMSPSADLDFLLLQQGAVTDHDRPI
jgi:hypothetical protein